MNKKKRLEYIETAIAEGQSVEEIANYLVENGGVTVATIEKDFDDNFPDVAEEAKMYLIVDEGDEAEEKGYVVPEGEEKDFHVLLEKVEYDNKTGEKKSKPFIQKYNPRTWLKLSKKIKAQGFDRIEILHDPGKK